MGRKRPRKHHPQGKAPVNIPQHIIDSGARALFERDCKDYRDGGGIATPDPWEQQSPTDQHAYRKRASAVIHATGKRIWDSGYEAGYENAPWDRYSEPDPEPIPNPYRSVNE